MFRPLLFVVICLVLGCGSAAPIRKSPIQVGWASLVDEYQANPTIADQNYRNVSIQVYLPTGTFQVGDGRITAYFGLPNAPGALVFLCDPPPGNTAPVLITGICRGRVNDGIIRANKIAFYVWVESCTVTVLGQ